MADARKNGAGAIGVKKEALNNAVKGRFIRLDSINSIFAHHPLIAAVLWVAQALAPLPSAIVIRALKKCALGHDENVLRDSMRKCATSSDSGLYALLGE